MTSLDLSAFQKVLTGKCRRKDEDFLSKSEREFLSDFLPKLIGGYHDGVNACIKEQVEKMDFEDNPALYVAALISRNTSLFRAENNEELNAHLQHINLFHEKMMIAEKEKAKIESIDFTINELALVRNLAFLMPYFTKIAEAKLIEPNTDLFALYQTIVTCNEIAVFFKKNFKMDLLSGREATHFSFFENGATIQHILDVFMAYKNHQTDQVAKPAHQNQNKS